MSVMTCSGTVVCLKKKKFQSKDDSGQEGIWNSSFLFILLPWDCAVLKFFFQCPSQHGNNVITEGYAVVTLLIVLLGPVGLNHKGLVYTFCLKSFSYQYSILVDAGYDVYCIRPCPSPPAKTPPICATNSLTTIAFWVTLRRRWSSYLKLKQTLKFVWNDSLGKKKKETSTHLNKP